ncbi:hypothetical protein PpBr36_08657 [Pyricularia pennisetigena]|uniref:hypothetical protein n=1 Tax=Pyricularia pennisetigena TaxID=1578925 RepID=UPI001150FCBD|nr:hypothetical protein PpBr36_08657 [Pyricularia pennisetigena]TLS24194.1 hypothetical protein PpBr36_08657 [Pyricularia pennisetigena]
MASNGQHPSPDCCQDSEDEYDSNGDYKGNHHGQLLLTAETFQNGSAWKASSADNPLATALPTGENGCKRRKYNQSLTVPKITVTSPDGLVSYGGWDTPVRMARRKKRPVDAQLLHVAWRPASGSEKPGCRSSSLQHEQGQYTLATIDDGIARLVMKKKNKKKKKKKKNASVEDNDGDDKLLDYEEYDWDD